MGMFDDVRVHASLMPDGYEGKDWFQTKDFECYLEKLEIRADGTLWHGEDNFDNMKQKMFHGVFNFYDYGADEKWRSYDAKFTDGKLVEITFAYDDYRNHEQTPPTPEAQG